MQNEIYEWVGGAFVHNHFRIDALIASLPPELIDSEMKEYMYRYNDGTFSLEAITIYLENIFKQKVLITDTQHPSYVLSADYDDLEDVDKVKFFNKEVVEATVDLLTKCILERRRIINQFEHLSHVLSGVEVDILDAKGTLTVQNVGLASLDYVTASLHSSIWYAAGNEEMNLATCMEMYNHVADNPNVDTISHPTFYLPKDLKLRMKAKDWQELFVHMKSTGVAFEINLDSTKLTYDAEGNNLDRELVIQAMKFGVPIVIGFDFHDIASWGGYPSPKLLVGEAEIRRLFQIHLDNGSIDKLLARVMGNIYALKEMGIKPSNIMNSTQTLFKYWLTES